MTALAIDDLSVILGQKKVVSDVSLHIDYGELVGIIGPNGAGKSSLLKAIMAIIPFSGKVRIAGHHTGAMTSLERAKLAAYIPQDHHISWGVSVATLVGFGRFAHRTAFRGFNQDDKLAIDEAVATMGIGDFLTKKATALSGGEQARVIIARALAQKTPLLFADEPVAGLDPGYQLSLMSCFKNIVASGRTVIVCLHDLSLAARWCSKLVLLDKGRIVIFAKPKQVLRSELLERVYGVRSYIANTDDGLIVQPISLIQD